MLTPFGRARRSQKQNLVCVEVSVRAFVGPSPPRCAWSLYSLLECARLRTGCLPNCVTLVRGRGLTPRRTLVCSFSMGALGVAWRMRTPRHTRPTRLFTIRCGRPVVVVSCGELCAYTRCACHIRESDTLLIHYAVAYYGRTVAAHVSCREDAAAFLIRPRTCVINVNAFV